MLYDKVDKLPSAVFRLPLQELSLCSLHEMTKIPEDIGALAPTLKKFELMGKHKVTSLPPSIARLTGLLSLTIQEVPTITGGDIATIGSLDWICAHMTQLTELNATAGGIDHVCFLSLAAVFAICIVSRSPSLAVTGGSHL